MADSSSSSGSSVSGTGVQNPQAAAERGPKSSDSVRSQNVERQGAGYDSTIGQKVDDTAITSKVKTALMADPDIKGMNINVTTMNGEVKLEGKVASEGQMKKAMEIARGVEGVTGVQNNLEVKTSS